MRPVDQARSTRAPRILVIRGDRMGDVVLTTPLIRALRETHPEAYLAALVRPYVKAVLEGNPRLDRILLDDPGGRDRGLLGFWALVRRVRAERFGISLMVLPTRRHAVLTLLAGIPTRISVGRKPYEVLTGCRPAGRQRDKPVRHEADYCLDLGRMVGVERGDLRPEVFLSEEEKTAGRRRLEMAGVRSGIVVALHPSSGHSAPNWRVERYAALARALVRELGAQVIVTGKAQEAALKRHVKEGEEEGILDFSGRLTVRELIGVIGCCSALVSSSTGPMHLAASLGVPCVSLFCPRTACSPERWGPLGAGHRVLVPRTNRCDGCHRTPECSFEDISAEEVLASVAGVVSRQDEKDLRSGCRL